LPTVPTGLGRAENFCHDDSSNAALESPWRSNLMRGSTEASQCRHTVLVMLMSSIAFVVPQVNSRSFALFRVVEALISPPSGSQVGGPDTVGPGSFRSTKPTATTEL
jgi:hypothetical protein